MSNPHRLRDYLKSIAAKMGLEIDLLDRGQLKVAIGNCEGKVTLVFGRSVTSILLTPEDAVRTAASLLTHANAARQREGL